MSNDAKARAAQPPAIGPGGRHGNRFAETEYAKDFSWTMKRIGSYFAKEKKLIFGMLAAVLGSTLFGIYAPMLQSNAVDIIAGQRSGDLKTTILFMLGTYLLMSLLRLAQGVFSARLSLRIVKQFREELFGKVIDLPIKYTDTHSHGDVMSRMTNDVENISTTVSQALPSLFSGVLTIAGTAAIMLWLSAGPVKLLHHLSHGHRHTPSFHVRTEIFQGTADPAGNHERHSGRNRQRLPHRSCLQ